jgi:hypothetical protein
MKGSSIQCAALALVVSGALACSADRAVSPPRSALTPGTVSLGAVNQGESASYTWHVFDDVTEASNGDRVELRGSGPLTIHPKSASGGGTFVHTNSAGTVLATGTYTVTELLSFQSYGPSPFLPPTFSAGKAQFRVELMPEGTTVVVEGLLDVECRLPGIDVPGGTVEGIRLVVPGVANFNKPVAGGTLFIRTS